jgi:hypothetical protein
LLRFARNDGGDDGVLNKKLLTSICLCPRITTLEMKELEDMYSNCGKAIFLGFIFCVMSIFTLSAQSSGTLIIAPNSADVNIYYDSTCYKIGGKSDLGNITKTLEPGVWTVDNGYEEKKVTIREGRTTNSTLKPFPDYGEPVAGQRLTVTGTKDKSSAPAWLGPFVTGGITEIQGLPQYAGRYCFVAVETSAHSLTENYLKHTIWQQIVSYIVSTISSSDPQNVDSDLQIADIATTLSTSSTSIFEGFSYTVSANQTEYESISKIDDRKLFESFLNRLNFRIEEFWWQKTSSKYSKGSKEEYHSYLLATVSKEEFHKAVAMALQNTIDNNPTLSATELSIYKDLINTILADK